MKYNFDSKINHRYYQCRKLLSLKSNNILVSIWNLNSLSFEFEFETPSFHIEQYLKIFKSACNFELQTWHSRHFDAVVRIGPWAHFRGRMITHLRNFPARRAGNRNKNLSMAPTCLLPLIHFRRTSRDTIKAHKIHGTHTRVALSTDAVAYQRRKRTQKRRRVTPVARSARTGEPRHRHGAIANGSRETRDGTQRAISQGFLNDKRRALD